MDKWDQRYDRPDFLFGAEPSLFLRNHADLLVPGLKVLAVADGEGRNSVFMAQKGCNVVAMDSSSVGLEKARRLAADKGVAVDFRVADLRTWEWEAAVFDMVAAIFIQFAEPAFRAEIFAGMKRSVKPGGTILLHGYTPKQVEYGTGGPPLPELMYTSALLEDAFGNFDIVELSEYEAELSEGSGHSGQSALIDLVARRPA